MKSDKIYKKEKGKTEISFSKKTKKKKPIFLISNYNYSTILKLQK